MEVFKQMQVWWKQIELSVRLVLGGHNLPTSPQLMIWQKVAVQLHTPPACPPASSNHPEMYV